jgi:hypothetical protein
VNEDELRDVTMTYGGVPTTVEGLKVCKEVLQARGLWQEE